MNEIELLTKKEKLEGILAKYSDLIEDEAKLVESEFAFKETSEELKQRLEQLRQDDRLLKIGVVGRVKAGKSSLLNSLFFDGENVLPKAATPMTAALTILSFGEEFSATIDFYSEKDLRDIEEKYLDVKRMLVTKSKFYFEEAKRNAERKKHPVGIAELEEKASRRALRELKSQDSYASYEHHQKIQEASVNLIELRANGKIRANSYQELMSQLEDYVGAKGLYMPFTKSASLSLADERLKGLQVIDTPGINDPVVSREQRTQELLKDCQVTLIVSPSGQFLSSEDLRLMDRISDKEGINELYLIGSKIDSQLREPGYTFDTILEHRLSALSSRVKEVLQGASSGTNDESLNLLITEAEERLLFNSSICQSIKNRLELGTAMDEAENHVWTKFLTRHFPENFSSDNLELSYKNLEKLANIQAIEDNISSVQSRKEKILEKNLAEFSSTKGKNLEKMIDAFIDRIKVKTDDVNNNDVDDLKNKLHKTRDLKEEISLEFEDSYSEFKGKVQVEIPQNLRSEINQVYDTHFEDVEGRSRTKNETYVVDRPGLGNRIARIFWGGGTETKSREITVVNTTAVDKIIRSFIGEIEKVIRSKYYGDLNRLVKKLDNEVASHVQRKSNSPLTTNDLRKMSRLIKTEISEFGELQFIPPTQTQEEKEVEPFSAIFNKPNHLSVLTALYDRFNGGVLKAHGKVEGTRADEYIEQAQEFLSTLQGEANECITDHFERLSKDLDRLDIAESTFGKISNDINNLTEQIQNREMTLDRLSILRSELKSI